MMSWQRRQVREWSLRRVPAADVGIEARRGQEVAARAETQDGHLAIQVERANLARLVLLEQRLRISHVGLLFQIL
jgi:hypothetical protein